MDSRNEFNRTSTGVTIARDAAPHTNESMEAGASGVLGTIVGKIAGQVGQVGGWWNSASEAIKELPEEDRKRYRLHFGSYERCPPTITFATALAAYALGHPPRSPHTESASSKGSSRTSATASASVTSRSTTLCATSRTTAIST